MFAIITPAGQKAYEQANEGRPDKTPELCGYYGRACRQMDKAEGANRALCLWCPLAAHCEAGKAVQP